MAAAKDQELRAIKRIIAILDALGDGAQNRVLGYIIDWSNDPARHEMEPAPGPAMFDGPTL